MTIKLQELIREEIPAKCKENTVYSTLAELVLKGGYKVQPEHAIENTNISNDTGSNQNDKAFIRGNNKSGRLQWYGINKFAKKPMAVGIAAKKTIIRPCKVTIELYKSEVNKTGNLSCIRKRKDIEEPITAEKTPTIKYNMATSI